MARERWKCPHDGCDGGSSRRWNCRRHIRNLHQCECSPVKEKSTTADCQLRPKGTQFMQNASRNRDSSHSKSLPVYNSLNSYQNTSDDLEDHSQKHGGITSKGDPIDMLYQTFKELKERNDKILEMRNYFKTHGSDFRLPLSSPLNIFDESAVDNILPSDVSSDYSAGNSRPAPSAPNKVIGYEIHNCEVCLESESLPVMCNPNEGNELFKKDHFCKPDKVNDVSKYPRFAKEDFHSYNILSSLKKITKTVKEWSRGRLYLVCFRVPSRENPTGMIDLKLEENQYSWLVRAIREESTILDERELKEFFTLTDCATFCCLSISLVQQRARKESFYFFLNYKPCVPFEN